MACTQRAAGLQASTSRSCATRAISLQAHRTGPPPQPGLSCAPALRCSHRAQPQHKRKVVAHTTTYTDKPVPNAWWRAVACAFYLIPMIDSSNMGQIMYSLIPITRIWFQVGQMFSPYYYIHQFMPIVVFFFMFLAIIKNKRLHHFVRFNAMQAMMFDIIVMLPGQAFKYIPGDVFWTPIGAFLANFAFMFIFVCVSWSVFNAMAGKYGDIPLVSEAVYMQVYQLEFL